MLSGMTSIWELRSLSLFLFRAAEPCAPSTLSLHDALPISAGRCGARPVSGIRGSICPRPGTWPRADRSANTTHRSEEHTSELQSRVDLVCRLLLEKKIEQQHRVSRTVSDTTCPHPGDRNTT